MDDQERISRVARGILAKKAAKRWQEAADIAAPVKRALDTSVAVKQDKQKHREVLAKASPGPRKLLSESKWHTSPVNTEDFYAFANWLGYTDIRPQPHMEMCEFIIEDVPTDLDFTSTSHGKRYAMLLVPRDTFKSTLGVVAFILYLLVKNPNLRILISSYRADVSIARLRAVKAHMEKNPKFIAEFGVWKPEFKSDKWSDEAIVIAARDYDDAIMIDPTIAIAGVDRPAVGAHPDVIIVDDPHNSKNVQTVGQRKLVYDHIEEMRPMLQPGGYMLVIGTRWAHNDAYGRIIKESRRLVEAGEPPLYRTLIRGAVNAKGELYFPTRLTHSALDRLRKTMTEKLFLSQYMLVTIESAENMFPEETLDIREFEFYYDNFQECGMLRVDREIIPVLTTIAWDTAGHKPSVTSDPHGITVNAMDSESHWWVAAALALKETPNTVVERIALLVIQYRPHTVSIEIVGQSGAWKTLLINRLQAIPRDILPVLPYIVENKPPTNMNKLNRLEQTLEPLFKNGCITICACEECKEFVSQLSDYPQVDHVDMIDSLAQHDKVARPPDLTRIFDDYDYEAMEVLAEGGALDDPRKRLGCYAGHNTARRFSKN